jgi:hypothetical protein
VGQSTFNYFGPSRVWGTWRYGGTNVTSGEPVPPDAHGVIAIIELLSDCAAFGVDPCFGTTNATPLFDNIAVVTQDWSQADAPIVQFAPGARYQDVGSHPSDLFDPMAPGPANVDLNLRRPQSQTALAGDSLVVFGPLPSSSDPNTRWEAKMWWRVAKRAPFQADIQNGQPSRYSEWRDRVSDGKNIDQTPEPEFTWGWMDSVELNFVVSRNRFCSYFAERDDDFRGENFDGMEPETEMIWDDVLYPGSKIEYFITSNYVATPNLLYDYPDTSGGNFFDRGAQGYIENALGWLLNDKQPCTTLVGCKNPRDRNWDRYDYLDCSSNWKIPFARGINNGMTLNQMLGYRSILLNLGTFGPGAAHDYDYGLYDWWLITPDCDANLLRQCFLANGDKTGTAMKLPGGAPFVWQGQTFLNSTLGASVNCNAFHGFTSDPGCVPPENAYCVQWLHNVGGPFPIASGIEIDAYGSYRPNLYGFNVYDPNLPGVPNRYYVADRIGGKRMDYAQICNEELAIGNYRTVLDGVSWHHLTIRDNGNCPQDVASITDAIIAELCEAMKWCCGVGTCLDIPRRTDAKWMAICEGTWPPPVDVGEVPMTPRADRLYQNRPNPFNPRTVIEFGLAHDGHVEILIYDVAGRLVRTLVDEEREAGVHALIWDGTDDSKHGVGSGIYWVQMKTSSYVSNKRMVVLR